mmetsp:Transcript_37477/g.63799  ORF Transcript_37477/g.63799 Transcript_37477/m.63799 type:complete len:97 (-) Transcript_37477:1516-1806(-)
MNMFNLVQYYLPAYGTQGSLLRSIPSAGFNVGLLYYPVQQLKYFLLQMSKVRPYLSKQDWDPCVESSKPRMAIKERMPMMTICPVHKIIASSNNRV